MTALGTCYFFLTVISELRLLAWRGEEWVRERPQLSTRPTALLQTLPTAPLHRGGKGGSERPSDLPEVTQLIKHL